MEVSGVFDGAMQRYVGTGALAVDSQAEDLPPMIRLAPGSVLKNVVIGKPAADGIHCTGTCYLQNVWWEDIGEDAATFSNYRDSAEFHDITAQSGIDICYVYTGNATGAEPSKVGNGADALHCLYQSSDIHRP